MIAQTTRAALFAMATVAIRTGAGKQVCKLRIDRLGFVLCSSNKRSHADDEELAQILVSHLGDPAKPLLATARLLHRGQPQLGGELPA